MTEGRLVAVAVPSPRPRTRDLGLAIGELDTGPLNAITDVGGVLVGHSTLCYDLVRVTERTAIRTGVTSVLPHNGNLYEDRLIGGGHVLNGFGKAAGMTQLMEVGLIDSPIVLTNTFGVGAAYDAVVTETLRRNPNMGVSLPTVNPIVGECNDSGLNAMHARRVGHDHALSSFHAAHDGPVEEGVVGAGTGMTCYGWKGGIGSSSRVVPARAGGFTVGVLLVANFGRARELTVAGVRVGRRLVPPPPMTGPDPDGSGSCVIVVATDAPTSSRQLRRIASRAASGLARTGSFGHHGSGDYVVAFSTAQMVPRAPGGPTVTGTVVAEDGYVIDALFAAASEATEEAVLNALFVAGPVTGVGGEVREALPVEAVMESLIAGRVADAASDASR